MISFTIGKEVKSMRKHETSLFAEDRSCGMWRLQTNEPALVAKMNGRAKQPASPWTITCRGLTVEDPMIYRRPFSSSTKARISLERILMRMDAEPYELVKVGIGIGWAVKRPSVRRNKLNRCHTSPNTKRVEMEKEVA